MRRYQHRDHADFDSGPEVARRDIMSPVYDNDHPLAEAFRTFVSDAQFPCVGAKAALARKQMDIVVAHSIKSAWDDLRIMPGLLGTIEKYRADKSLFRTFVVIFADDTAMPEEAFEKMMWQRIQSLTDKDDWLGYKPDPSVDSDPESPHFSLSFGDEAFFVVGLHQGASRPARQFSHAALVFNLHDQFVELRESGKYQKMRETIIDRDVSLAGDANPMLALHGVSSEARQYSGRNVSQDWQCPYHRKAA